jgi:hypothetical protein
MLGSLPSPSGRAKAFGNRYCALFDFRWMTRAMLA